MYVILPHVGQEIRVAAFDANPNVLRSSRATFTSSTGSALSEIRIVLPIPMFKIAPKPAALLTVPANNVPLSVIPRCSG